MQGDWSLGWFCGNTFYSPYDAFLPQARWVADLTRPLREGVGKLLAEHRPFQREPVAFLYSQPSLYSMGILGKTIDPANPHLMVRPADWARDSLQRMLTDAGVQFSYVSEKQVQQDHARGIRLLVLSSCVALEPATCKALEQFVANGGIVLADLCPGVWDHHGTYHSPGQLDQPVRRQTHRAIRLRCHAGRLGRGRVRGRAGLQPPRRLADRPVLREDAAGRRRPGLGQAHLRPDEAAGVRLQADRQGRRDLDELPGDRVPPRARTLAAVGRDGGPEAGRHHAGA